jgi:hypothetical protein
LGLKVLEFFVASEEALPTILAVLPETFLTFMRLPRNGQGAALWGDIQKMLTLLGTTDIRLRLVQNGQEQEILPELSEEIQQENCHVRSL